MKAFTKDLSHYMVLFGILMAGFVGLVLFPYDKIFQIAVTAGLVSSYVSWGIAHHFLHGDLHLKIVIEYLAVALLGFVIILSMVIRA